jgi:hypothetical protein
MYLDPKPEGCREWVDPRVSSGKQRVNPALVCTGESQGDRRTQRGTTGRDTLRERPREATRLSSLQKYTHSHSNRRPALNPKP